MTFCVCIFYLSICASACLCLCVWMFCYQSSHFATSPGISFIYVPQCLTAQSIINLFQLAFVFSSVFLSNSQNGAIFSCYSPIFSCLLTSDAEACCVVCCAPWISNLKLNSANAEEVQWHCCCSTRYSNQLQIMFTKV